MSDGKVARELVREADRLLGAARRLGDDHGQAQAAVRAALAPLRTEQARGELAQIPAARLKDVTGGRLRLTALEKAGYDNVLKYLDAGPYTLQLVPGVGPQTAAQAHAAAGQIARALEETVTVRIDVDQRDDPATTALVAALHRLVAAGPELRRATEQAATTERALAALLPDARRAAG